MAGSAKGTAAGVNLADVDALRLGQRLHRGLGFGQSGLCPAAFVGNLALDDGVDQICVCRLGVGQALGQFRVGGLADVVSIDEVDSLPAGRCLDGVERGDGFAPGQVVAGGIAHLQFSHCENEVVFSLEQLGGGQANVTALGSVGLEMLRGDSRVALVNAGAVGDEDGVPGELGIVRCLEFVANGKTESVADIVVAIVSADQRDARDIHRFAEVDLHPFGDVRLGDDLAVVTGLGPWLGRSLFAKFAELFGEFRKLGAALGLDVAFNLFQRGLMFRDLFLERRLFFSRLRVGVVFAICSVERGKDGLHAVIVGHVDRVELVIVAAGALHGGADEGVHRVLHHVVSVDISGDSAVELGLRHLGVPDEIPRAGGDESEPLDAVPRVGKQRVSGDLFLHEAAVRLVAVEGADNVVAVRPGVGAGLVLVVTVSVAVVDDVQPVARPAFAVAGRGEQPLDQLLVGQRVGVGDELADFIRGRRQAKQVVVHTADQRVAIGLGGMGQLLFAELGRDEVVDRVPRPVTVRLAKRRRCLSVNRLERPDGKSILGVGLGFLRGRNGRLAKRQYDSDEGNGTQVCSQKQHLNQPAHALRETGES